MSKKNRILDLIQPSLTQGATNDLATLTVRVSASQKDFIDEVAALNNKTRQDVLLAFIENGIDEVVEKTEKLEHYQEKLELALNEWSDDKTRIFLLNTNKRHNSKTTSMMKTRGIAAAFYSWGKSIHRIAKGDFICLYENGKGIISFGQAEEETLTEDYEGDKDACTYKKLSNYRILKNPMKPQKIRDELGYNLPFLNTLRVIAEKDSKKLINALNDMEFIEQPLN